MGELDFRAKLPLDLTESATIIISSSTGKREEGIFLDDNYYRYTNIASPIDPLYNFCSMT